MNSLAVVSGGQTGVDRAALDVALELGLPCGGWCPAGRRAEDGPIPARYPLKETVEEDYAVRTERNVTDSDATLVLTVGKPTGGTAQTVKFAKAHRKPCFVLDLDAPPLDGVIRTWIESHDVRTLNIAGPRESGQPGIHERARVFLARLLG